MGLVYFKRFRMELDLGRPLFDEPPLPPGYSLVPWDDDLLEAHARTKYRCFCDELDAHVFPCFSDYSGCLRLMRDITQRDGFLAGTTWLAHCGVPGSPDSEYIGTIQGLENQQGLGAVQNVGIVPSHRGRGLGTCLIYKALLGFRAAGLRRVTLEVTAKNRGAIGLYRRLGFRQIRTLYRVAEVAYA